MPGARCRAGREARTVDEASAAADRRGGVRTGRAARLDQGRRGRSVAVVACAQPAGAVDGAVRRPPAVHPPPPGDDAQSRRRAAPRTHRPGAGRTGQGGGSGARRARSVAPPARRAAALCLAPAHPAPAGAARAPPQPPYRSRHGGARARRLNDELDAAIVLAPEVDSSVYSRRLSRNRVVAIAARSLTEGEGAIREPGDLGRATILLHRDMPLNFQLWREALGVPDLEPAAIDHFDSGQLMLESAAEGLGVALMLDLHFEGAHDPRLTSLFAEDVDSHIAYWFVCRRPALQRRPVKLFHDWLVDGLAA
ncbi:hypothetical protein SLE2022_405710 [Rubroshorea leprosula]